MFFEQICSPVLIVEQNLPVHQPFFHEHIHKGKGTLPQQDADIQT